MMSIRPILTPTFASAGNTTPSAPLTKQEMMAVSTATNDPTAYSAAKYKASGCMAASGEKYPIAETTAMIVRAEDARTKCFAGPEAVVSGCTLT